MQKLERTLTLENWKQFREAGTRGKGGRSGRGLKIQLEMKTADRMGRALQSEVKEGGLVPKAEESP